MAARGNDGYFDSVECPYSETLKNYLKRLIEVRGVIEDAKKLFDVPEGSKFDVVQDEIEATIEQMRALEDRIIVEKLTLDPSERIALIKAKTALLEKWINQRSQIFTMKEMAIFQSTVIAFMDEVLTKDQVALFRKRLAGLRSVGNVMDVVDVVEVIS